MLDLNEAYSEVSSGYLPDNFDFLTAKTQKFWLLGMSLILLFLDFFCPTVTFKADY